jgi:NAD+ diphosphatase
MFDDPTHRLGFVRSRLIRHSAERDGECLERHAADPRAQTVLIAGETPILRVAGDAVTSLLPLADLDRAPSRREQVFLGLLDDGPVLATLAGPDAVEAFGDESVYRTLDLRSIAVQGVVPAEELGILAAAKALLHWHAHHRFCSQCGAPSSVSCAGFRRDCGACGAQHFPRTDPVAIMLVTRGDRCLLGRQARFPAGMYSCLAGFIEPGETIEDAVRRETFEEAGVRVGAVRYLASQPWPFPSSLMIGCVAEGLDDGLTLDRAELEDGRWFSRDEVRLMLEHRHPDGLSTPLPFAIANALIRSFVEDKSAPAPLKSVGAGADAQVRSA